MAVRTTLLWKLSQLCNPLRDSPVHCRGLLCAYSLPCREVSWEEHENIAVSMRADGFAGQRLKAVSGYICCGHKLGYSWRQQWVLHHMPLVQGCPCGSKFEPKGLFSLQVACNCLPGYSGDGVSQCNPINLCEQVCLHFAASRGEGHSLEVFPSPRS